MKIGEEAGREGGAEQNEKEGTHQQNTVHSYKSAIRSTGDLGCGVKLYKSGHYVKKLFPSPFSKGKQLIVHDKLTAFCSLPRLCKISFPAFLFFSPPPFPSIVEAPVLYFLHALQMLKKGTDIYWARVYLYSGSSLTICQLLWARSGKTLKQLILY